MKVNENLSILFMREKSKASKDGMAPIWARITVQGSKRAEFSLGIKVAEQDWDQESERAKQKGTLSNPAVRQINAAIVQTLSDLQRHYYVLESQFNTVTSELLKQSYKGALPGQQEKVKAKKEPQEEEQIKEVTLCQALNYKYSKFAVMVKAGQRSENTLRRWKTTKRKIREFLKFTFGTWDVPLSAIKYKHAGDMLHFLLTQQRLEENTACKYLKNTRELLEIGETREWITKNLWEKYPIKYVQPERECLLMHEIITFYQKPLIERLDHVRNVFLFSCFTGYSFQEVLNLTKDDIFIGMDGKRWIKIDRQKTGNPECLPLLPIPAAIVDRYANDPYCIINNKLLPVKSYQNYNGYLKEAAYICELRIEPTPHVARHTFATTICLDNGVPIEVVSTMLGHTNIRTTQIYAKVSKKNISQTMTELERKLFTPEGKLIVQKYNIISIAPEQTKIAV